MTKISPRFIYGWSNLANTEVAFGDLSSAEENYSKAIELCKESMDGSEEKFGVRRCSDMYILRLNRGTVRLNNGMQKEALADLQQASILRERPDATILQNLARAKELNGLYSMADKDYNLAISMTANEVSPFWLRSALVKYQLGNRSEGLDILKRVENRFPEAVSVMPSSWLDLPIRRLTKSNFCISPKFVLPTLCSWQQTEIKSQRKENFWKSQIDND